MRRHRAHYDVTVMNMGSTKLPVGLVHGSVMTTHIKNWIYRQISNMRGTKSQSLNDSHLVLKSSLPNPLKPGVKSRMKM